MTIGGGNQYLGAAGFQASCGCLGDHGREVATTTAPATSSTVCDSRANGVPAPFTARLRFLPPGLVGSRCDHGSNQVPQSAVFSRPVGEDEPAEVVPLPMPPAREQRQFDIGYTAGIASERGRIRNCPPSPAAVCVDPVLLPVCFRHNTASHSGPWRPTRPHGNQRQATSQPRTQHQSCTRQTSNPFTIRRRTPCTINR